MDSLTFNLYCSCKLKESAFLLRDNCLSDEFVLSLRSFKFAERWKVFKSVGMYITFNKNKIKAFDVPEINQ